jgi:hypothetical protein
MTIEEFLTWQAQQARRNETLADPDAILQMPSLGLAITLATLYERVPLTPRPRPKLVWEDDGV